MKITKKLLAVITIAMISIIAMTGCGGSNQPQGTYVHNMSDYGVTITMTVGEDEKGTMEIAYEDGTKANSNIKITESKYTSTDYQIVDDGDGKLDIFLSYEYDKSGDTVKIAEGYLGAAGDTTNQILLNGAVFEKK